ncbi:1-deoxy-D-xylulose-5-phosphate reductoisomerase, partial [candidate division KSB1 bacterium]|nr:1-deoxy-D-xylulose-5-phosphate reductoisomerase [candidate division KSB1 bacterium]
NWKMGNKVTIDSSTLMNKGLEVIEAHWLFGIQPEKIDVVTHEQSIVHSMVEFIDGSIKSQMGIPDMKIPVQFAMTYPDRFPGKIDNISFFSRMKLTFEPPDEEKFPCLNIAYRALEAGGTAPAAMNAANEVAVELFLNRKIKFTEIPELIDRTLQDHKITHKPTIQDYMDADKWARSVTQEKVMA